MKIWKGQDLKGLWEISFKIDGVQAIYEDGLWKSRANKPLYNLPNKPNGIYEVFYKDWNTTVSLVRKKIGKQISEDCLYSLDPIDKRLLITSEINPTNNLIKEIFKRALELNYEGLVLRCNNKYLKVKPKITYDVPVLSYKEGKGKFLNTLGYVETPMGNVGTGFTNQERQDFWNNQIKRIIEVECMHLTKEGKFRHPVFLRDRFDKSLDI